MTFAEEMEMPQVWQVSSSEYKEWALHEVGKYAKSGSWRKFKENRVIAVPCWPDGVRWPPIFCGMTATPEAMQALAEGNDSAVSVCAPCGMVHLKTEKPFWPAMIIAPYVEWTDPDPV